MSMLPVTKHKGQIKLGAEDIDCYVLDDGRRVVGMRMATKELLGAENANLRQNLARLSKKGLIDADLVLRQIVRFRIPGTQLIGVGFEARAFNDVLRAYAGAFAAGQLSGQAAQAAIKAVVLLSSLADVGLVAAIDEATGHQKERADDELRVKLAAYIGEHMAKWTMLFPPSFWDGLDRLYGVKRAENGERPLFYAQCVKLVYETMDPDVYAEMKRRVPEPQTTGVRQHQALSPFGRSQMMPHVMGCIGMMRACSSGPEWRELMKQEFGGQLRLPLKGVKRRSAVE